MTPAEIPKVITTHQGLTEKSSILTMAILIIIGISAGVTSLYISQNAHSLIYRYRGQKRELFGLMDEFDKKFGSSNGSNLSRDSIHMFAEWSLKYETLMMNELADWTDITIENGLDVSAA